MFDDSYQEQEFDMKFKELWEINWELTRQEVRADINVFINDETTWADEEKNKRWGGDCRRQAVEHRDEYISEKAHTNINILKGKIIADFEKLANRKLKLNSRVGNPLQGRGVLGGRNRYMV